MSYSISSYDSLLSYRKQDSVVLAKGQTYKLMRQTGESRSRPKYIRSIDFQKRNHGSSGEKEKSLQQMVPAQLDSHMTQMIIIPKT